MMRTAEFSYLILFSLAVAFIPFTHCDSQVQKEKKTESKQNILDLRLPAMYSGTLPCADCPGINYRLIIEEDRFVEISHYQDRSPGSFEETGIWRLNADTLTLSQQDDKNFKKRFLVDEQSLRLLDSKNQQISGDLSEMYVLDRTGNQPSIREHHQRLADQGFKFYAGGNEPFWSVKMDSLNNLIYETPDSTLRFSDTDSTKNENQVILKASSESIQITIQAGNNYCQDSMSGYLFPRKATVYLQMVNRDTLTGCGLFLNSS